MQNRNFQKSSQKRTDSQLKFDRDSFQVSNSKKYLFLQDDFCQNLHSNIPSPIMKMKFEHSSNFSQEDILNYSSNTFIQDQHSLNNHRSYAQSPQKENKYDTRLNYLATKKYSIPDAKMLTEVFHKQKCDQNLKNYGSGEIARPLRKLNGKRTGFKLQNEEDFDKRYRTGETQFHSQKLIDNNLAIFEGQNYNTLARNYQQLERQYERMREQNQKLRKSKDELMNQNVRIKRQDSFKIQDLSKEIQSLKEQIYRMQMERHQEGPTSRMTVNNRMSYSRDGMFLSGRSNGFKVDNGVNLFYVEQLQKQNDQLMRQNRRLNQIIMKRLKHSIAE